MKTNLENKSLIPIDDGACDHLVGLRMPDVNLLSTDGCEINLRTLTESLAVIFFYPATGVPGRDPAVDPAPGWDFIPGAAGCTAQACSFRDLYAELKSLGAKIIGISTQLAEEQKEFLNRKSIPFALASDSSLLAMKALNLPVFQVGDRAFIKRLTLIVEKEIIKKVFYPVYPTERNAEEVLIWLQNQYTTDMI